VLDLVASELVGESLGALATLLRLVHPTIHVRALPVITELLQTIEAREELVGGGDGQLPEIVEGLGLVFAARLGFLLAHSSPQFRYGPKALLCGWLGREPQVRHGPKPHPCARSER